VLSNTCSTVSRRGVSEVVDIVQTYVERLFDASEEERTMSAVTLSPRVFPRVSRPSAVRRAPARPAQSGPATVRPATLRPATARPATLRPATARPAAVVSVAPVDSASRAVRQAPRSVAGTSGGQLHLTARGRWVVRCVALVVAAGAVLTGGRAMAEGLGSPLAVDSYTVGSGETLWSIATSFAAPGEDVRDVVDEISALNGMSGSGLTAGDQILVPVER
jgi:nucleoid-associated protein YgaU